MNAVLDSTARRLEVDLADAQSRGRLPSMVAAVVRDGALAWSGGRGRCVSREPGERPHADTQYKIGSVTKTMTAALVMLARQRGDLALSDPVSRFLPRGPHPDASLRSLLCHAAGISAEPLGSWWERSPGVDLDSFVDRHQDAATVLEPGSQMHYSNTGYGVLGEVVASVTGSSWFDALDEQVLRPLGMKRTTYQMQEPYAEGFAVDFLTGELTAEPLPDTGVMAPAGQLWSTANDLGTWLTALADPERSVLSAESLVAMRTPQASTSEDRSGASYGLGLQVQPADGRMLVGHGGSMPGFVCGVWVDPDSTVGGIVLSNGAYGLDSLASRLVRSVLEHEPPLAREWLPRATVRPDERELVGTWHWGHAPALLRLCDDGFTMAPPQGPGRVMSFRRVDADCYVGTGGYLTGETLRVVRRDDGSVSHLEVATFVYTRVPYDPSAPIPGGVTAPD